MKRATSNLRKVGNYYVLENDAITIAVVQAHPNIHPFDLLWKIREETRKSFGDDYANDIVPDEPIRRIVGRVSGTRLGR